MELSEKQREILKELDVFFSKQYKYKKYKPYLNEIKEYLLLNALDYNKVNYSRQGVAFTFNGREIVELVDSIMFDFPSDNSYIFWEHFYKPILYYGPAKVKNLIDVINNNEEVTSFTIDLMEEHCIFYKTYISNTTAYIEEYEPTKKKAIARIYDAYELKDAIEELSKKKNERNVQSSWRNFVETPAILCNIKPKTIVSMNVDDRNGCSRCYYTVIGDKRNMKIVEAMNSDDGKHIYAKFKKYLRENEYIEDNLHIENSKKYRNTLK